MVLGTEIDWRLLWPGTPSNVFACASFNAAAALASSAAFALACASVMIGFGRTGLGGVAPEMRNEAARVMRGGVGGGAVEATTIDSVRLCPGTLANICWRASFVGGVRGPRSRSFLGGVTPARKSAARVVRGTMVGEACDGGISRALKGVRREVPSVLGELPAGEFPFVLEGMRRRELLSDEERDRSELVVRVRPSVE